MKKKNSLTVVIVITAVFILFVLVFLLLMVNKMTEKDKKPDTISLSIYDGDDEPENKPSVEKDSADKQVSDYEDDQENDNGEVEDPVASNPTNKGPSIFDVPFEDGYQFPDLSDFDFVFLGDSIFEMSNSDTSMPMQLGVYTNSRVYVLSMSGSCAGNNSNGRISLHGLTECFADQRETGYEENKSFNRDIPKFKKDKHKSKSLVIIINHCINDYTHSTRLSNPDNPYDLESYEGALRSSVSRLKSAYPSATIVFMEPYVIGINDQGTVVNYDNHVMDDYIASMEKIAGEFGLMCFNLRSYDFFKEYRDGYLLDDYLHPNEMASKTMARLWCDFVENNLK